MWGGSAERVDLVVRSQALAQADAKQELRIVDVGNVEEGTNQPVEADAVLSFGTGQRMLLQGQVAGQQQGDVSVSCPSLPLCRL